GRCVARACSRRRPARGGAHAQLGAPCRDDAEKRAAAARVGRRAPPRSPIASSHNAAVAAASRLLQRAGVLYRSILSPAMGHHSGAAWRSVGVREAAVSQGWPPPVARLAGATPTAVRLPYVPRVHA